jgi:ABC-type phosphate transport system substrate-binding protein
MKIVSMFALFCAMALPSLSAADNPCPKTIAQYDSVRVALASDNLGAAKKSAETLAAAAKEESVNQILEASGKLAASKSLEEARAQFQAISLELHKLVNGKPGFYAVTCPMIKGSLWIQTSEKIGNPYAGKEMQECGEIKK